MTSSLDQLKKHTVVVSDTGEFELIAKYKPQDATTNPSLLFKAAQLPAYKSLMTKAIEYAKNHKDLSQDKQVELVMDKLSVLFGVEILKLIQGRVSTEIDARLSYDTEATVARCLVLARLYEEEGVDWKKRVLFKIASTWQGIKAAEILEQFGYHCNLTLLFSFAQAVACAEARVTLISPFVGRILDYHKAEQKRDWLSEPHNDPGVVSVRRIYNYYKKFGYKTIVMGASFRNVGEIHELAGVDYLTISPELLEELSKSNKPVEPKLSVEMAKADTSIVKVTMSEKEFNWGQCNDACATVKLAEGIRGFAQHIDGLEKYIRTQM